MAKVEIKAGSTILADGLLQLQNGVAMDGTLRNVADQSNTTSPLKLSTSLVSVSSTLQIATNDTQYLDAEDTGGNNRFTISRNAGSQVVNVDFASNPTLGTEQVGAIRTYQDGVSLSDSISFLKNGNVGVGTNSPSEKFVIQNDNGGAAFIVQANSYAYASLKRFSNNVTRARYETYKARGTAQSPISINTLDEIGSVDFYGYDGSNFQRNAIIFCEAENVSGGVITPTLRFGLGTTAPNNQYRLSIFNNGNVSIGQESDGNSRLIIKGSGSTTATTSLLVKNSSGTELLKVDDGEKINLRSTVLINHPTNSLRVLRLGWGSIYGDDSNSELSIGADYDIPSSPSIVLGGSTRGTGANTMQLQAINGVSVASSFTSPNSSAQLDISSTTKGFLPPRMTTAEKLAIASPAAGLQVYDSTLNQMSYYNGATWINF